MKMQWLIAGALCIAGHTWRKSCGFMVSKCTAVQIAYTCLYGCCVWGFHSNCVCAIKGAISVQQR